MRPDPRAATRVRPPGHRPAGLVRLAVAAVLAVALGRAAAGQPPPLRVAVAGPADEAAYLPVHAAAALGTFEAEGVAVQLRRVKHPTAAVTALREREADVAVTTLDQAIHGAWMRELPVRILVAHTRAPAVALMVAASARDAIRRVEDLRGRAAGIPGPGTTAHLLLLSLLRRARVEPWQVALRSIGGAPLAARVAAGDPPAGMVEEPWVSRLLEADRAVALLDLRRPEETARVLGGAFYEVVSVAVDAARREADRRKAEKGKRKAATPPAEEGPPAAALAAYARAVIRAQAWLAATAPDAVADRLPAAVVGDRAQFVARLGALRATYVPDGDATPEGLGATLRVLREGTPWPVSLKLEPKDLTPPGAVVDARRALGAAPPSP
jgi:NitT/TauT family transport system substrate-binding protein